MRIILKNHKVILDITVHNISPMIKYEYIGEIYSDGMKSHSYCMVTFLSFPYTLNEIIIVYG